MSVARVVGNGIIKIPFGSNELEVDLWRFVVRVKWIDFWSPFDLFSIYFCSFELLEISFYLFFLYVQVEIWRTGKFISSWDFQWLFVPFESNYRIFLKRLRKYDFITYQVERNYLLPSYVIYQDRYMISL